MEKAHYLLIINCVLQIMLVNGRIEHCTVDLLAYYFLNIPNIANVFKSNELSN